MSWCCWYWCCYLYLWTRSMSWEKTLHFYLRISVGHDVLFATDDTLLYENYGDDLTEDHHHFLVCVTACSDSPELRHVTQTPFRKTSSDFSPIFPLGVMSVKLDMTRPRWCTNHNHILIFSITHTHTHTDRLLSNRILFGDLFRLWMWAIIRP